MSGRPSLEPGAVIAGDFVIVRLLGEGGMGAVYVAEQKSTGKLRALKMMLREMSLDTSLQRRFEQEAKVGGRIQSGHVVEVIAAGIDRGLAYLVMELLEGVDLRRHLRQRGLLPPAEVRAIFEQLCHGVAAAHAVGIVHRDLKPENIFLARSDRADSSERVVKVLDYGIAKVVAEAGTRATAAVGSPLWMAPEQTTPGPVTPAADVWALGLIAYEALTGAHFWRSASAASATPMHLLREIVLDPIPPASERAGHALPPGFDEWFRRCVARAPGDRFQDAAAAWRAMQEWLPPPESAHSASGRASGETTDPLAATAAASSYESQPLVPSRPERSDERGNTPSGLAGSRAPIVATDGDGARARPDGSRFTAIGAAGIGVAGLIAGVLLARYTGRPAGTASPVGLVPTVPSMPAVPSPNVPAAPATPGVPTLATAPLASPPPAAPAAPASTPSAVPAMTEAAAPAPATALALPRAASAGTAPATPVPPASNAGLPRTAPAPGAARLPPDRDGFRDPHDTARIGDENGPQILHVQGRQARLFTKVVDNQSNVATETVRSAIDHSAWRYTRCYELTFAGAKDVTDGTVTIGFDIIQQLPMHATLVSSTFANPEMTRCVIQTLSGQTINAAGSQGSGHIVYAFQFVLVD